MKNKVSDNPETFCFFKFIFVYKFKMKFMGLTKTSVAIDKCEKKYNGKYTLNLDGEYIDRDSQVLCKCNMHNTQKYVNLRHFLCGEACGCDICLNTAKKEKAKNDYINKFIKTWGDGYTFDKLEYVDWKHSGILTCKQHGDFVIDQIRYAFDNIPCPVCYENYKNNARNNNFLTRLKEKYGSVYKWLTVDFGDYYKDYVKFLCPTHGVVKQTLAVLLNTNDEDGYACPKCRKERQNIKQSYTLEGAIEKAKKNKSCKHYDFSLIEKWNGVKEKYPLKCKKHGDMFYQSFDSIFHGVNSCPSCIKEIRSKISAEQSLTTEEFIKKAMEIHGNKFDYSHVNYVNYKTKVELICPKHGPFMIKPGNHLGKVEGCPKCHETSLETKIRVLLENNNIEFIYEKSVRDLTGKMEGAAPQRVDFFLPKYNLCIECQGEQHFHPTKLNSKMNNETAHDIFLKTISRDKFKYESLKEYGFETIFFTKFSFIKYDLEGWYSDKKCFYDLNSILEYIKTLDYNSIKRNWYDEKKYILVPFKKVVKTTWNKETCYLEAQKYKTRSEFAKHSQTAYGYACKNKWIDDYTWFNELHHKWIYEECFEIAQKCNSKKEFEHFNRNAYKAACRNKWINDYTWFNELHHKWTYEECFEIAKKYKSRAEFKKHSHKAFKASESKKWINAFIWLS